MIDLKKHGKAKVLAALYNGSRPLGLGFLHFEPIEMTEDEAQELLNEDYFFDYIKGRVMKCSFKGDELDTRLYNRDNGPNAAENIIESLSGKE